MEWHYSHPIKIVSNTARQMFLLAIPILRALFFTNMNFYQWLKWAWIDVVAIFMMLVIGVILFLCSRYALTSEGIYFKQGVFVTRNGFLPYRKLSAVVMEQPFFLRPLQVAKVYADSDAGYAGVSDFSITITAEKAQAFLRLVRSYSVDESRAKRAYYAFPWEVAVLSFLTSNSLSGILFTSAFISGTGDFLGADIHELVVGNFVHVLNKVSLGIPPIAAWTAYILLIGWLISFGMSTVRYLKYTAVRQGGNLYIRNGILTKRQYSLTVSNINQIRIVQSLLTKLLGVYSVFLKCNGYGKQKNELSVLFPSGRKSTVKSDILLLFPELPFCERQIKPFLKVLSRFLVPPVSLLLGIGAAWGVVYLWFWGNFRDTLLFILVMAVVPAAWFLFVKIASYFHTGIGYRDGVYTIRYTYGYQFMTAAIPREKIAQFVIYQSLFQKTSQCCDVIFYTVAEGRTRQRVANLRMSEALEMMRRSEHEAC